jgi:hypothetical protein
MFVGRKLWVTLAFTVLMAVAFGVGCRGFFQPNVLESIVIQPPSVNLSVNAVQQFSAYGTYEDGTRSLISTGLIWTSSSPSISITAGGSATGLTVTSAAATITGSAQGLSGTATASVIGDVVNMTVSPTTGTVTAGGQSVTFTFAATPGPPTFITEDDGGTLTTTPDDGIFTCTVGVNQDNNPAEVCALSSGGTPSSSYTLFMSYPSTSGGTVNSPTATVTVTGS